ncbi:MAG: M23 family metallopeptidase, partial [Bacteroidia bacterium]|nr:M23 family metallopeptidase [Bacteroidia bacterium]
TPICAAREGVVVEIKDDAQEGGKDRRYASQANYIIILHPDGTLAHYWHLRPEGCAVKVGDRVNPGDIIGYSGNTGCLAPRICTLWSNDLSIWI